jgi:hypothetical protein
VAPLAMVENLDVLLDGGLRFGARGKPSMMDECVLEAAPEALPGRVVVAVALDATWRGFQPEISEHSPVIVAAVRAVD